MHLFWASHETNARRVLEGFIHLHHPGLVCLVWPPMKLHYFNQALADEDDHILREMIALSAVPERCLLGGVAVRAQVRIGQDPCASCEGPAERNGEEGRERCGGRPKDSELSNSEKGVHNTSAGALKAVRAEWIRLVRQWGTERTTKEERGIPPRGEW